MPAMPAPITHTPTRVPAGSGERSGVAELIQGERDFTCNVMARLRERGGRWTGRRERRFEEAVLASGLWQNGRAGRRDRPGPMEPTSTRPDKASWTFRSQEEACVQYGAWMCSRQ